MRIGSCGLLAVVVALAGCGAGSSHPAGRPYDLYTHCGIEWAKIEGTFWRATHPLSDGNGNPPPGWGNPAQAGRLRFIGPATAEFDSPAGRVTFHRTSRTEPPLLCS